jgi:PIN domain nuclease of toxin-antitoxin system
MILLDTCAILWDALEPKRLSKKARKAIELGDTQGKLVIADISLWEIATLIYKKRVEVPTATGHFLSLLLQARNIRVLPITAEIAELAYRFGSELNNDPADRLIVATAAAHQAQLLTADRNLQKCGLVETLW